MRKFLVAMALLSAPAYAQLVVPEMGELEFTPNGVITFAEATPTNGGINPAFSGVKLEGTIKVGGNSCDAQRYEVGISKATVDGKLVLTPFFKEKADTQDIMCIAMYDYNWKGLPFSQTFVAPASEIEGAVVQNVMVEGNDVELSTLFANVNKCESIRRPCFKLYQPHSCSALVGGEILTAESNNQCEAINALEIKVCNAKQVFNEAEVVCTQTREQF